MSKNNYPKGLILFFIIIWGGYLVHYYYTTPKFVEISELLINPDKYHGKKVLVVGKIVDAKYKETEWGPKYTVYKLSDGTGVIKVFADGFKDPEMCYWAKGVKIWVVGKYYKEKHVRSYVFFNQIDAEEIGLTSEEMRKVQTYLDKLYDCRKDCEKYADPESCKEFCKNNILTPKPPKDN
jgi:RPA family protein